MLSEKKLLIGLRVEREYDQCKKESLYLRIVM